MYKSFIVKCRMYIEETIDVPISGFCIKRETALRLCYIVKGKRRYIVRKTPLAIAKLLKDSRIIHFYSVTDEGITMYAIKLVTTVGELGQPIQKETIVPVTLEEIDLNPGIVQTIAAEYEMKRNKVLKMFIKEAFQAA